MDDTYIIGAMKEAIREAMEKAANEEIERQKHRFECEMGQMKAKIIGELVNMVDIRARKDLGNLNYVIQIVLAGSREQKEEPHAE